jgi:hypothetical protein
MTAAIVLERVGTPLLDAPFYSIMRALQGAPHTLLRRSMMPLRNPTSVILLILILAEVAATLASQFMSTLLLTDFGDARVTNPSSSQIVRSTYGSAGLGHAPAYWTIPPAASWRFGEYSTDSFVDGGHFHDTGHIYRAFLPLEDEQERSHLRKFHGPADVLDFRVVCVNPTLKDLALTSKSVTPTLTGSISVNASYSMLQGTPMADSIDFACSMPHNNYPKNGTATGLSDLCYMGLSSVRLENPLVDPATTVAEEGGLEARSKLFLIADFIYDDGSLFQHITSSAPGNRTEIPVVRGDGPWSVAAGIDGKDLLRVTACYVNLGSKVFGVEMDSAQDAQEPTVPWSRALNSYDTASTRYQLGAELESPSPQDRGLLTLNERRDWQEIDGNAILDDAYSINYANYFVDMANSMPLQYDSGLGVTSASNIILSNHTLSSNPAHEVHTALIQDTLRLTKSPAIALQALLTRVCQMIYYDRLGRAPVIGSATTGFSTGVLIPVRWIGFVGTVIIISTHVCVILITTLLFAGYAGKSELGNTWQALAHVATEETREIIEEARNLNDDRVSELLESKYADLAGVKVLQCGQDGSIFLAPKYKGD